MRNIQKRVKKVVMQSLVCGLMSICAEQASAELINTNRPDGVSSEEWESFLADCTFFAAMDNMPIQFFGKIEDQNGVPVQGATVRVSVTSYLEDASVQWATGGGETVDQLIDLVTDESGYFVLNGVRGRSLDINSITKVGFKDVPKHRSYTYGERHGVRHTPDPHRPDVFRILRQGETEPLIRTVGAAWMFADKKYGIDLMTGKFRDAVGDESSHLVLSIQIDPSPKGRKDWTVFVEAPRGGIIAFEDDFDFMLEAPEEGYNESIEWGMSKDDPKWTSRLSRNIFFRSNDGSVFAAINVQIYVGSDKVNVELTSVVNPRGSRNLEYDPAKRIKKKVVMVFGTITEKCMRKSQIIIISVSIIMFAVLAARFWVSAPENSLRNFSGPDTQGSRTVVFSGCRLA
jgi:hypothetical protein